ncbi:putative leucine-rich repeat domain-containing protein [Blattamonas nauphoetae]|uniref:Leucine-rich repeat domain-containing protein n=1 Tax=Blattamonas nauphoetae TaxID=2049346 RepID=A0ABQ9X2D8_9EUKA|nr:putative leucine-rich repeat domain-containing protein [Blattamonas nauphoetae]
MGQTESRDLSQSNVTFANQNLRVFPEQLLKEPRANITILNLSNNHIHDIPDISTFLPQLDTLNLTKNQLRDIPQSLSLNTTLDKLMMSYNPIEQFGHVVMHTLRELVMSNTPLQEITHNIGALFPQLQKLRISNNRLYELPLIHNKELVEVNSDGNFISSLTESIFAPKLTSLILSFNRISRFTLPALSNLESLAILDLRFNQMVDIDIDSLTCLKSLKHLRLTMNSLKRLPDDLIEKIPSLEVLWIGENLLEKLPDSIIDMSPCLSINAQSNHITSVPFLSKLKSPTGSQLQLNSNYIQYIPPLSSEVKSIGADDNLITDFADVVDFGFVKKNSDNIAKDNGGLKILNMRYNKLGGIPRAFCRMPLCMTVNTLVLSGNGITHIPSDLAKMRRLMTLDLSFNSIKTIPDTICEMYNLQTLNLSFNDIEELPPLLLSLSNLKNLRLSANRIKRLPTSDEVLNCPKPFSSSFSSPPAGIGSPGWSLSPLIRLSLDMNELDSFPEILLKMPYIQTLTLAHNTLTQIPRDLFLSLQALTRIDVSFNEISSVSPFLIPAEFKGAVFIDLSHNKISSLPIEIVRLVGELDPLHLRQLGHSLSSSMEKEAERVAVSGKEDENGTDTEGSGKEGENENEDEKEKSGGEDITKSEGSSDDVIVSVPVSKPKVLPAGRAEFLKSAQRRTGMSNSMVTKMKKTFVTYLDVSFNRLDVLPVGSELDGLVRIVNTTTPPNTIAECSSQVEDTKEAHSRTVAAFRPHFLSTFSSCSPYLSQVFMSHASELSLRFAESLYQPTLVRSLSASTVALNQSPFWTFGTLNLLEQGIKRRLEEKKEEGREAHKKTEDHPNQLPAGVFGSSSPISSGSSLISHLIEDFAPNEPTNASPSPASSPSPDLSIISSVELFKLALRQPKVKQTDPPEIGKRFVPCSECADVDFEKMEEEMKRKEEEEERRRKEEEDEEAERELREMMEREAAQVAKEQEEKEKAEKEKEEEKDEKETENEDEKDEEGKQAEEKDDNISAEQVVTDKEDTPTPLKEKEDDNKTTESAPETTKEEDKSENESKTEVITDEKMKEFGRSERETEGAGDEQKAESEKKETIAEDSKEGEKDKRPETELTIPKIEEESTDNDDSAPEPLTPVQSPESSADTKSSDDAPIDSAQKEEADGVDKVEDEKKEEVKEEKNEDAKEVEKKEEAKEEEKKKEERKMDFAEFKSTTNLNPKPKTGFYRRKENAPLSTPISTQEVSDSPLEKESEKKKKVEESVDEKKGLLDDVPQASLKIHSVGISETNGVRPSMEDAAILLPTSGWDVEALVEAGELNTLAFLLKFPQELRFTRRGVEMMQNALMDRRSSEVFVEGMRGCGIFAVFDGHKGDQASHFVSTHFVDAFLICAHLSLEEREKEKTRKSEQQKTDQPETDPKIEEIPSISPRPFLVTILERTFDYLIEKMHVLDVPDGCTVIMAVVTPYRVYTVNMGDSRGVLVSRVRETREKTRSVVVKGREMEMEEEKKKEMEEERREEDSEADLITIPDADETNKRTKDENNHNTQDDDQKNNEKNTKSTQTQPDKQKTFVTCGTQYEEDPIPLPQTPILPYSQELALTRHLRPLFPHSLSSSTTRLIARPLSSDHKPVDLREFNYIRSVLGWVGAERRVNGMLAVARSMGDFDEAPFVCNEADITLQTLVRPRDDEDGGRRGRIGDGRGIGEEEVSDEAMLDWMERVVPFSPVLHPLSEPHHNPSIPREDVAIVLGCDGVFDVLSNDQIADLVDYSIAQVRRRTEGKDVDEKQELAEFSAVAIRVAACELDSMDNISVLVVVL